jgi:L-lysine 6-oxidase
MGDDPAEFYFGPDVPEPDLFSIKAFKLASGAPVAVSTAAGKNRSSAGKIRRQAVRFRVYEIKKSASGRWISAREITKADCSAMTWSVHIANLKSFTAAEDGPFSTRKPLDPGEKKLNGKAATPGNEHKVADVASPFPNRLPAGSPARIKLAEFFLDDKGRLCALSGHGTFANDGSPTSGLRSKGWCDDVCDGPVRCQLTIGGKPHEAAQAWLVTSVPKFVREITHFISVYERAVDIAYRNKQWLFPGIDAAGKPINVSFERHVWPILHRTVLHYWISQSIRTRHTPKPNTNFVGRRSELDDPTDVDTLRKFILGMLQVPPGVVVPPPAPGSTPQPRSMPILLGSTTLFPGGGSFSSYQYHLFSEWALGKFVKGKAPVPKALDKRSTLAQLGALNEASMGSMCGESYDPGIEVGENASRDILWGRAFRLKDVPTPSGGTGASATPGHTWPTSWISAFDAKNAPVPGILGETLSVPWPIDFHACALTMGGDWWPSARPVEVWPETRPMTGTNRDFKDWMRGVTSDDDLIHKWSKLGFVKKSSTDYLETERTLP